MKKLRPTLNIFWVGSLLGIILMTPNPIYSQEAGLENRLPKGVYIKLTRDFYEALRDEGVEGTRVYTDNPSNEYLKEIAISNRFIVETNLEILKQQERMIDILQSILRKSKK